MPVRRCMHWQFRQTWIWCRQEAYGTCVHGTILSCIHYALNDTGTGCTRTRGTRRRRHTLHTTRGAKVFTRVSMGDLWPCCEMGQLISCTLHSPFFSNLTCDVHWWRSSPEPSHLTCIVKAWGWSCEWAHMWDTKCDNCTCVCVCYISTRVVVWHTFVRWSTV